MKKKTIAFILFPITACIGLSVLNLTGLTNFGWVWVMAPLWVPLLFGFMLFWIMFTIYLIDEAKSKRKKVL